MESFTEIKRTMFSGQMNEAHKTRFLKLAS